jgi:hypothetical protein
MRIITESESEIVYDMKEIVRKILQVLKEDQSLNFGPRMKSSKTTKKSLEESISKKKQLLDRSMKTHAEMEKKLEEMKKSNDSLRAQLLEQLGSEI